MKKLKLFPEGETISSVIWMLFMLIPMLSLAPYDTFLKQFFAALLILFALCYRNTLFQGKYLVYWIIFQYLIAWLYVLRIGYIYLFMFPAWQLGIFRKQTFWPLYSLQLFLMVSGLLLGPITQPVFGGEQLIMTLAFSLFTVIAPLSGREWHRQQEQRQQLYQANKRLEGVIKGEERNRIARELHDSLGQSLSVMTIKLDLAQKILAKKPEVAASELKEIEGLSRSTLKTVREIVSDMRRRSIAEELIDINQALTAAKIILTTDNEELSQKLSVFQQTQLSSVLREAVTNVVRHSKASSCQISFVNSENCLQVSIKDNGIGPKKIKAGNGLTGMKERIQELNGSLMLEEQLGTLLRITIPLKEVTDD